MRGFRIRRASIPAAVRTKLEQYGVAVVQQIIAADHFEYKRPDLSESTITREDALSWLTEQYDREERRETWTITMEAAVTLLVFAELLVGIATFVFTDYEFKKQNDQFGKQVTHQEQQFASQMQGLSTQLGVLQKLDANATKTATILEAEQTHQQAIERAKPHLVLYWEGAALSPNGPPPSTRPYGPVIFQLENRCTADATGINMRIYGEGIVSDLKCNNESFPVHHEPVLEGEQWSTVIRIEVPVSLAKRKDRLTLSITFVPRDFDGLHHEGSVYFQSQTKESPAWTPLGPFRVSFYI